jgi:predicted Fe-Mo cluster-binding NifX family protein
MNSRTKIALPVHNGRVAPVFDWAERVLVVDAEGGHAIRRQEEHWGALSLPERLRKLSELRIQTLICGGISAPLIEAIQADGTKVIPWIAGEVEQVLTAFMADQLFGSQWSMPGCCGQQRGWRRGARGCGGQGPGQRQGRAWRQT